MKIFMTGATGFVGAHTAIELLKAGHELRLLVRDPQKAKDYFAARAYQIDDLVVADMSDSDVIKQAMQGCDAVFHAAAKVSLDPRDADEVYTGNTRSIAAVVQAAFELGIKNIVWVSSLSALFSPGAIRFDESSPLGNPHDAYSRSKRDCDEFVRRLQAQGAPIQVSYPSGVIGPDDPGLSESNKALQAFMKTIPNTSSGIQCVDVRDLAIAHRYMLEHPPASFNEARYIIAGNFFKWRDFHAMMETVTGRTIPSPKIPGQVMRAMGFVADLLKKISSFNSPISAEAMAIVTQWSVADSSKILNSANMSFRPTADTIRDSLGWQVDAGYLRASRLGKEFFESS